MKRAHLLPILLVVVWIVLADEPPRPGADDSVIMDTTAVRAWLHVDVETSYGWFWQKSAGRAWTTADKEGKQRVKVGKLCLCLDGHESQTRCVENADSIVIREKKRGLGIPKRKAVVTAWAENPQLDTTRVELEP